MHFDVVWVIRQPVIDRHWQMYDGLVTPPLGVILAAHALYLAECAPKRLRGMVGVTIGTFLALGRFSGQLLGIR